MYLRTRKASATIFGLLSLSNLEIWIEILFFRLIFLFQMNFFENWNNFSSLWMPCDVISNDFSKTFCRISEHRKFRRFMWNLMTKTFTVIRIMICASYEFFRRLQWWSIRTVKRKSRIYRHVSGWQHHVLLSSVEVYLTSITRVQLLSPEK